MRPLWRPLNPELLRDIDVHIPIHLLLAEQTQVDLEHRLQQTHVSTLVQADLVLPHVHNQDLRRGERK